MAEYHWGKLMMIIFIPFSKPLMGDIFLADIPIQIFQAIKRKTSNGVI